MYCLPSRNYNHFSIKLKTVIFDSSLKIYCRNSQCYSKLVKLAISIKNNSNVQNNTNTPLSIYSLSFNHCERIHMTIEGWHEHIRKYNDDKRIRSFPILQHFFLRGLFYQMKIRRRLVAALNMYKNENLHHELLHLKLSL